MLNFPVGTMIDRNLTLNGAFHSERPSNPMVVALCLFRLIYGVGSKLGPFAAFAAARTDARKWHVFIELPQQPASAEGESAQGSGVRLNH